MTQDPLALKIGENIRHYRKLKGMTQQGLGGEVSLDPKSLSRMEGGWRMPGLPLIERIATALDVQMWQLVDRDRQQAQELEELRAICQIGDLTDKQRQLIIDIAANCVDYFRQGDADTK